MRVAEMSIPSSSSTYSLGSCEQLVAAHADQLVGQQRGRRGRDRAALALEGDLGDPVVVVELDVDVLLVAAEAGCCPRTRGRSRPAARSCAAACSARGSGRGRAHPLRRSCSTSCEALDQAVDLVAGVVDGEAGAGGGRDAEALHQRSGRSGGRRGRRRRGGRGSRRRRGGGRPRARRRGCRRGRRRRAARRRRRPVDLGQALERVGGQLELGRVDGVDARARRASAPRRRARPPRRSAACRPRTWPGRSAQVISSRPTFLIIEPPPMNGRHLLEQLAAPEEDADARSARRPCGR